MWADNKCDPIAVMEEAMNASCAVIRKAIALTCAVLLISGGSTLCAGEPLHAALPQEESAALPNEQLDSLVAPIALYPDPLLAQTLVASTYPLELIQLQQWLAKNPALKDKALADAVQKQNWDPSIQAMAAFPDLVKRLAENIAWTTDLGNAFLAQQNDVMDAVQRMRAKAKSNGNLKSSKQQKVETKVVDNKSVVVIEPASTEVVYIPSYNPTVVYGAAPYPYPPVTYPPPGYAAAGMALSFGVGVAMGAAWGGGWGYHSGWGGNNNVYINHNNTYVNNSNRQNFNNQSINRSAKVGGSNSWQHNPQHRGGAPYPNPNMANRYGGTARGDSLSNRQASARQNLGSSARPQAGTMDSRTGARNQAGNMDRGGSSGFGGGGDRVGNRSVSPSSNSRSSGAFGGGGGMSGSSARASSSRGSSSMSASRGGGSRGGGGGRRR